MTLCRSQSFFLALISAACIFAASPLSAAERTPLLLEGKKTLHQRIISHPGAQLRQNPAKDAKVVRDQVKTFTAFYVYARQDGWLEVGASLAQADGWLQEDDATRWDQSLTLLFTERTGRERVLFFKDDTALQELCAAQDMEARLQKLQADVEKARGGQLDPGLPVMAAEPAEAQGAVSQKRFYLMPILKMAEPFEGVKFLQVSSIDPAQSQKNADKGESGPPRTGIAFVIDTTISMKPYIDQSLNVIRSIYDSLEKSSLSDSVGFAVVAFRNSIKAKPGLEYTAKVVSDFKTAVKRKDLETELAKVGEAKISSHSFNEDSLAGIKTAVDSLNWGSYASRMVILLTDAGPLPAGDPYASVKMDVRELADYAKTRGIWLSATHIQSPSGRQNHSEAEKAYRSLTLLSNNRSNYLAIPASTPQEGAKHFGAVASTLARSLVTMVKDTAEGKMMTRPPSETTVKVSPEAQAAELGQMLGYAMQLEYLGRQKGTRAPSVIDAWITDMDLLQLAKNRQSPTVQVAVLLTKNQLSDLQQQLKIIIDNAERTKKTDSRDFFQGILGASAKMVRDPSRLGSAEAKNLNELGVLGEFLDGLPYKSDIMLLREEDWYRMSVGEQTSFINRLKSRIARYEEYDKDSSNWESFGSSQAGDWVYRVPLTMLP
ncbi:MAG: VWA domain-containing protein [Desulfovibrionaceae bacterium]|nr:VWA domain-containing protein [Desulfovibrionaceae bacterium]